MYTTVFAKEREKLSLAEHILNIPSSVSKIIINAIPEKFRVHPPNMI